MDPEELEKQKKRDAIAKLKATKNKEKEFESKLEELDKDLVSKNVELKSANEKNASLERLLEAEKMTVQDLQAQLSGKESQLVEQSKSNEQLTKRIKSFEQGSLDLEAQIQRLNTQLKELNTQKDEHLAIENKLNQLNQTLADEKQNLTKQFQKLQITCEELQNKVNLLEDQKKEIENEFAQKIAGLEEENKGKLQGEITELQKERQEIRQEYNKQKQSDDAEIEKLKDEIAQTKEEVEKQKGEVEKQKGEVEKQKIAIKRLFGDCKKNQDTLQALEEKLITTLDKWMKIVADFSIKLHQNLLLKSKPSQKIEVQKGQSKTEAFTNYLGSLTLQTQSEILYPYVQKLLEATKCDRKDVTPKNCDVAFTDIVQIIGQSVSILPAKQTLKAEGSRVILMQTKHNLHLYSVCLKNNDADSPIWIYYAKGSDEHISNQILLGSITKIEEDKGEIKTCFGKYAPTNKRIFRVYLDKTEKANPDFALKTERPNLHQIANHNYQGTATQTGKLTILPSKQNVGLLREEPPREQLSMQTKPKKKIQIVSEGFL